MVEHTHNRYSSSTLLNRTFHGTYKQQPRSSNLLNKSYFLGMDIRKYFGIKPNKPKPKPKLSTNVLAAVAVKSAADVGPVCLGVYTSVA